MNQQSMPNMQANMPGNMLGMPGMPGMTGMPQIPQMGQMSQMGQMGMQGGMNPMGNPTRVPRGAGFGADENTLYVGNLNKRTSDERIFSLFSAFGPIQSSRILKDGYNGGESRGFGFISFKSKNNAKNALDALRYTELDGRFITVNWKKESPKNLDKEANLYVKNLDKNVTEKFLYESMAEFGEVSSVYIKRSHNGESIGYGYVQFKTVEDSLVAIEKANGVKLHDSEISVQKFQPRKNRAVSTKNNLYVRNFPEELKDEEAVVAYLTEVFGAYGEIVSQAVQFNEKNSAFSAFVAYKDPTVAQRALDELKDTEVKGHTLFVTMAMTKEQRLNDIKRNSTTAKNETNFHLRSLRSDITKEEISEVFSKFGEVTSTHVVPHKFNNKEGAPEKQMAQGFVNFKVAADASNCFASAKEDEQVKSLLSPDHRAGMEFIHYHQPKDVRSKYNKVTHKNMQSNSMVHYQKQFMNLMKMFQNQMRGGNMGGNKGFRGNNRNNNNSQQDMMKMNMMMMQNNMRGGMNMQNMGMPNMGMMNGQQGMMPQ